MLPGCLTVFSQSRRLAESSALSGGSGKSYQSQESLSRNHKIQRKKAELTEGLFSPVVAGGRVLLFLTFFDLLESTKELIRCCLS